MRNRYLKSILAAGAMMLPVAMIGQTAQTGASETSQPKATFSPSMTVQQTVLKKSAPIGKGIQHRKAMPMKVAEPKGEAIPYSLNEFVSDGSWISTYRGGVATDIYFDGNDVYYRDIVSLTGDGEYLMGTITDGDRLNGVLTFENGAQCAADQWVYVATTDADGYLVPDMEAKDFSFSIQDGVITPIVDGLATPNMYLLAVGADDYIYSYSSIISIVPVTWDTTSISVPEGLTKTEVMVANHVYGSDELTGQFLAHQAIDGDNIYLTDIFRECVDATLLLKKSGDSAKISNGSYVGIFNDCYTYIYAGKITGTQTDDYGNEVAIIGIDTDCKELKFRISEEGKITTDNMLLLLQGEIAMVGALYKPVIEPYNPGVPAVMPTSAKIDSMLLQTDDLSSPSKVVYKYADVKVGVDGDDVYFGGFVLDYPDFTFKGKYNDDKTKITITLPQYLGTNQYGAHIFLYDGSVEEVPYSEDYSYVNCYYSEDPTVLEMGVEDDEYYLDGVLVVAELLYSASEGFVNPVISRLPELEEVTVPDNVEKMAYGLTWKTGLSSDARTSKRVTVASEGADYYFYDFADGDNKLAFKGTKTEDGNSIKVDFPQYCGLDSEGRPIYAMLGIGREVDLGYGVVTLFNNTLERETVTFSLGNGSISTDRIINVAALDNVFSSMIAPEWKNIDSTVPEMPTDGETYILNYGNLTTTLRPMPMKVAMVGDQCFMDFNINGKSCVVEGRMHDGKIEVKAPAYVNDEALLWLSGGEFDYDESGDAITVIDDSQTTLTFEYDAQKQCITCPEVLLFHDLGGSIVSVVVDGVLTKYLENGMPPEVPVINNWYFVSMFDQYAMECEIPWTATDGSPLDTDDMFFRVWFDNEVFIWSPEVYDNFTEPVENVPYNTSTDLIAAYYNSDSYDLWFNVSPNQYIGLQSGVVQNGKYYWSEIVWYDVISHTIVDDPYLGVETVGASGADVISREYYTIDGQRIDRPSKGIAIEKTTYMNGKTSARKVVVR